MLARPGASVLLVGAPGCGKSYFAQSAAYTFESAAEPNARYLVISDIHELLGDHLTSHPESHQQVSERLIESLRSRAGDHELIVVALNIDRYAADESAVLEHLVRSKQLRFIGTTQQVIGAADRLARNPAVHLLAVEPLSLEETNLLLSQVFGVDQVAQQPLQRWHEATHGNPHALVTLALSATRRGIVQRVRNTAWIAAGDEHAPVDLIAQLGELTPDEQTALELVSLAAPLHEPALFELLDAAAVKSLMDRQVLTVRTNAEGITALTTEVPVLADAVLAHLSPLRRTELARQCFDALLADDATLTTASRLRLVRFGIEVGAELPAHWLCQALRAMSHSGDHWFVLRLALAAMHHEHPQQAAIAMLRAADLSYFLGDAQALEESLAAIAALISHPERFEAIPLELQVSLAIISVCFDPLFHSRPELALAEFDGWARHWHQPDTIAVRVIDSCRMRMLSLNGRLSEAQEIARRAGTAHDLEAEWISAPTQTFKALLCVQRGEFKQAAALAETMRQLTLLHEISPTISGDLEGFTVFLAHWARGTTVSARQALASLTGPARADLAAVRARSGLVELARALFAMQEARWYDTSEIADRLIETLTSNDPFGVTPFAHAILALAQAALGFKDRATDELLKSEQLVPGVSMALQGFVGMVRLRTRHWLRDPDLRTHALDLASWAAQEDLPLIELKALDVVAHEMGHLEPDELERASELASMVDPPIGEAILAHIHALTDSDSADSEPEERLLSELGVWMPLPPVGQLTGREREIALFTALGHSSRYIAERLHLSARTIETHLAHVYTKLGVDGRDGLRHWFSQRRESE